MLFRSTTDKEYAGDLLHIPYQSFRHLTTMDDIDKADLVVLIKGSVLGDQAPVPGEDYPVRVDPEPREEPLCRAGAGGYCLHPPVREPYCHHAIHAPFLIKPVSPPVS